MFKTAYDTLKINKNASPTQLNVNGKVTHSPKEMANAFNQIFVNKAKKLKSQTEGQPSITPKERLKAWLEQRGKVLKKFELKPINLEHLRFIMKKVKGKKGHGFDYMDAYSLKLAFPKIEDVLLHLVNLSLKNGEFAEC